MKQPGIRIVQYLRFLRNKGNMNINKVLIRIKIGKLEKFLSYKLVEGNKGSILKRREYMLV